MKGFLKFGPNELLVILKLIPGARRSSDETFEISWKKISRNLWSSLLWSSVNCGASFLWILKNLPPGKHIKLLETPMKPSETFLSFSAIIQIHPETLWNTQRSPDTPENPGSAPETYRYMWRIRFSSEEIEKKTFRYPHETPREQWSASNTSGTPVIPWNSLKLSWGLLKPLRSTGTSLNPLKYVEVPLRTPGALLRPLKTLWDLLKQHSDTL